MKFSLSEFRSNVPDEHISIQEYAKMHNASLYDIVDEVYNDMPELCRNPDRSKYENACAYWRLHNLIKSSEDYYI